MKNKKLIKNNTEESQVLVQPRITEKATMMAEGGVYVFEVNPNATKKETD